MCMRACVCVCHYLLHATLSLIPLGFLLKAAKEKEIMESKGRRRSVIKDTGCETGKCRDFLLQNSLFKGKSVPEEGGARPSSGDHSWCAGVSWLSRSVAEPLRPPGREVECREGRRHPSSVLAASGHVDVCAPLQCGLPVPESQQSPGFSPLRSGVLRQDCTVSGSTCQR